MSRRSRRRAVQWCVYDRNYGYWVDRRTTKRRDEREAMKQEILDTDA